MTDRSKLSIFTMLLFVLLLEISNCSFAQATYTIDPGFTQITIQSPISNESYNESSITLVADVKLIYGTSSTLDEFSFEKLSCSYCIDGDEWTNFTSMEVTSNTASPSINFWNGFVHKLNVTYSSTLQNLTDGLHSARIRLVSNDSFREYQDTANVNFTIIPTSSHLPSPTIPEFPSQIILSIAALSVAFLFVVVKWKKKTRNFPIIASFQPQPVFVPHFSP